KLDGRWWLVTPEGKLFFSVGVDCVGPGEHTFIDGRDRWFEWLPEETGPFAQFIHRQQGAHSMAEPIAGKGRTFSFYCANLVRKFGDPWRERWEQTSAARLRNWGFNTIGNWSDWGFMAKARIPFVASGGVTGTPRRIEGGGGYWGKMVDVYDPAFAKAAEDGLSGVARHFAKNPYCIGYFGDNEIAWEAVERGPLASPPDQPCRIAQVEMLKARHGSLDQLNAVWETQAPSWDALRVPDKANAACREDLNAFQYAFARRYFEICKAVFKKHAPHQLYLGCRFSSAPKPAVRACADVADVVSFNLYNREINPADWTGANALSKPILIGEFHFGALDRGMFHEGLVPCIDQQERAKAYADYVRSVVTCPAFVGCHWFQYVDEPITGRWFDGENYNIGLVDVTDTPYPELTDSARAIQKEIYRLRSSAPKLN
ncbi:MAG TPA: beta-galactosidase, partial [Verrucomicrobiota bacterium]|nr:beta-galactosidase [Verrucomicrobiota bacterium]